MKSFKNNFFVKTAYAYVNLIYIIFLFIITILLFTTIFGLFTHSNVINSSFLNGNLLGVWPKNKSITENTSWLFILIVNVSIAAGIYYCLKRLKAFLKNVYEDRPFIKENGKHLKIIGILIMFFSTIIYIIKIFATQNNDLTISQLLKYLLLFANIISSLFNPYFIIGLVIFVIGEVIINASKIKEELDLTV